MEDLRVFKQKQTPATVRNTARSEMTLGASTWASKRREVSSVSGGCSSCIRLLPVGDNVVNRYSACVEPALLYAVTRSSYLVPLSRFIMENLDCGCTLFETATELGSLRETDRDDALGTIFRSRLFVRFTVNIFLCLFGSIDRAEKQEEKIGHSNDETIRGNRIRILNETYRATNHRATSCIRPQNRAKGSPRLATSSTPT